MGVADSGRSRGGTSHQAWVWQADATVDGLAGGGRRGAAHHYQGVRLPGRGKLGGRDHAAGVQHLVHLRAEVWLATTVTAARDKTLDGPDPQRRHRPHCICATAGACAAPSPWWCSRQYAAVGGLVLVVGEDFLRGGRRFRGRVLPAQARAGVGGLA